MTSKKLEGCGEGRNQTEKKERRIQTAEQSHSTSKEPNWRGDSYRQSRSNTIIFAFRFLRCLPSVYSILSCGSFLVSFLALLICAVWKQRRCAEASVKSAACEFFTSQSNMDRDSNIRSKRLRLTR